MIEIKFRTWDGEQYWYNVVPSPIPSRTLDACTEIKGFEPEYDNEVDIISGVETIEQYTGLKDKNGKEIYEGDVLEWKLGDFINRMVVRWNQDECCFELHFFKGHFGDSLLTKDDANSDYEVIGNIHENPELLEKGEK